MGVNQDKIDEWFTYHPPKGDQVERMQRINAKAKELAEVIDECCPNDADKFAAFRHVRDARTTANASIACGEAGD